MLLMVSSSAQAEATWPSEMFASPRFNRVPPAFRVVIDAGHDVAYAEFIVKFLG